MIFSSQTQYVHISHAVYYAEHPIWFYYLILFNVQGGPGGIDMVGDFRANAYIAQPKIRATLAIDREREAAGPGIYLGNKPTVVIAGKDLIIGMDWPRWVVI